MSEKIFKAISFANQAHKFQLRKGTNIPYVVHPIQVMHLVASCDGTEEMQIAALLHDVLEDTQVSENEILTNFGESILSMIQDLTEPKLQEDKSLSWKKRKIHTLENLKIIPRNTLCIALCDKFDNLASIQREKWFEGNKIWKRFNADLQDQKWYYESLVKIFLTRKNEINFKFSFLVNKFADIQKEVFDNESF